MENLTISKLAEAADVHVETVRFYQRKGLLPEPQRPLGGIRRYGAADVSRLAYIKSAQRIGFSLEEIGELLRVNNDPRCEQAREIVAARLTDVRARLSQLRKMEAALSKLMNECAATRRADRCRLMAPLRRAAART
jgi:MerR family transcriptional regulator, mercuric resistance operon regulatory protein